MRVAHVIVKVGKMQDLQLAHRRPSQNTGRLEAQEEPMIQLECESKKKTDASAQKQPGRRSTLLRKWISFLFYPGLQLIGWGPPTWGRATCFTRSTNSNVNKHTQNNVWPNVWALHGPGKLTRKINCHAWQGTICHHKGNFYQISICQCSSSSANSSALFFLPAFFFSVHYFLFLFFLPAPGGNALEWKLTFVVQQSTSCVPLGTLSHSPHEKKEGQEGSLKWQQPWESHCSPKLCLVYVNNQYCQCPD